MAILFSEDEIVKSSFEIVLLDTNIKIQERNSWVPYKLILKSADKKLEYTKSQTGTGDFVFALSPKDEILELTNSMSELLSVTSKTKYSFEPLEPSFELEIEKSHKGYSIYIWVDAGNVVSDHYTWDGLGIRFFTTEEKIQCFIEELKREVKEYNYA
ncbi:MAG: hypothetical protein HYR97_06380 [Candidatus Melainabacteria bacterium]|nr:hypothetical protein [Candidatus Melainabacteria bacterium]MBI3308799.1 hypothetical protein [Candidatus Melainabacteria bacterium]